MLERLAHHAGAGTDIEEIRRYVPESYLMRECRLSVRPAEEIKELIEQILQHYKDRKYVVKGDARRGTEDQQRSLVSERTMAKWAENKRHVEQGCLNDPTGQGMYLLKPDAREVGTQEGPSIHTPPDLLC